MLSIALMMLILPAADKVKSPSETARLLPFTLMSEVAPERVLTSKLSVKFRLEAILVMVSISVSEVFLLPFNTGCLLLPLI